ncbi:MAG: PSD1 and planctomycete cytochrome C domain-containing protein [Verrucomicrobiales bacterium]|nr:PSD1 and planctomycete cytochrome C domain-containing protein [Verrucomicrobiales bacterium]
MLKLPITTLALSCLTAASPAADISYNRDVLPVLATKCFPCHGADSANRKADLRLDQRQNATAIHGTTHPIKPGAPGQSELVHRIFSTDPGETMPPPEEPLRLSPAEKSVLRSWIEQGAVYQQHWAFQPPHKKPTPTPRDWGHNPVDHFVYARLNTTGLSPQPPAPRGQLIRRATLDITGLPPTTAEVDHFLSDTSPLAYENLVDRLLASPRFGERMASWWLDGARYGDSHGYDNDLENSQWPWRNWVVDSFNNNKPFDRFTTEQLAGDLLPDATPNQVLATAFNRNHRIQTEDGAIDEEWRTEYVIDRVQTMGTVWLGLTLSCARCHDHKYDPISQKEFYQLFSLFNNIDEKGFINNLRGSAEPKVRYKQDTYQQLAASVDANVDGPQQRGSELAKLDAQFPMVMVMREMPAARTAHILHRGQYDSPGAAVQPGLPAALPPLQNGQTIDRLGLARWLTDPDHPLTARVFVNRIWEQLFASGIVETSENLGIQAAWPTHPKLLDWLAVDFVENGWDVKHLVKTITTSATYRQHHATDPHRLQHDPYNKLLSRGPRGRLTAEMVRDQALALSGLLHEQIGGPSVNPYQPAGLWEEVEKRGTFQRGNGTDLYRRSLYTTVRRTVAPPGMLLFDMPSRELCTVRRTHTNTPLQALALMNEVTYIEATIHFAARMGNHGTSTRDRIAWGFRAATSRHPHPAELEVLAGGYRRRLQHFRSNPTDAKAATSHGASPVNSALPPAELAALTTVASVILNLDELINK